MQLITQTKAIWDEWASRYGYESNISQIIEVYEQLFKAKQSAHCLQDYYVSTHGLLTQLEMYKLYTIDLTTQHCYREELATTIFLASLDTSISS